MQQRMVQVFQCLFNQVGDPSEHPGFVLDQAQPQLLQAFEE